MATYRVLHSPGGTAADGVLLDDFRFPWLDRPCPRTEFRAVHDGERLHFRFDVDDEDLVLGDSPDPGQAALGSDRVELFFAPDPELSRPYYGAEMDPAVRVYDYRARYHREFDDAWSFRSLDFRSEIRRGGYAVSGSLALAELAELGCLSDGVIVVGVYRAEFSHAPDGAIVEDWISWIDPGTETPDFHVPGSFGRFRLDP